MAQPFAWTQDLFDFVLPINLHLVVMISLKIEFGVVPECKRQSVQEKQSRMSKGRNGISNAESALLLQDCDIRVWHP